MTLARCPSENGNEIETASSGSSIDRIESIYQRGTHACGDSRALDHASRTHGVWFLISKLIRASSNNKACRFRDSKRKTQQNHSSGVIVVPPGPGRNRRADRRKGAPM
jgi:hypothetical protein